MSGTTFGISGNAPVGYGLFGVLIANEQIAKQRVTTLTQQTADGLVSDSYDGLGTDAAKSLNLNPQIAHETTWANNITAADGTIQVTQTAMTQLTAIATNFYSQSETLNSLDPAGVDSLAASARQALVQVAALLDTKNGNAYVFAGQDSANPPVPNPDTILSSGLYTQINAAVGQLSTNGATATAASTLAIASSNAVGTSPFSTALSQPAANVAALQTMATVEDNRQVPIGLLASTNASVTSTGTSTTGSYTRDLMRALATIGSLTGAQVNDLGFTNLIQDTQTSLNGAITAMGQEAGVLGNTQSAMDASGSMITDTKTALTVLVSNIQNVDLATVATQLAAAQTQLQASYQMISGATKLSLVSYI